ncbi:hypothetical protein Tcan_15558 [Toxocara canis]|uniref:Uncharacterized protein n=1 Tax=Toxocara canis TaxID=6265 RepID=A0A0B2VKA7_TOXCA|nr:hypothetical protein Tcan_15558 [Toxocara canis]
MKIAIDAAEKRKYLFVYRTAAAELGQFITRISVPQNDISSEDNRSSRLELCTVMTATGRIASKERKTAVNRQFHSNDEEGLQLERDRDYAQEIL